MVFMTQEQRQRHCVRPGLSGLAQINGRNCIEWEDKFKFDLEYINRISFSEDFKIVCKTVVKHAAALVSGTAALHLAVKLAGVKPGDVVFCSDLTFAATVNPVSYEGGVQVFIDSEKDTWNMDPQALEKAFEKYPDCKCVIVVNLYGVPAKLDEIRSICDAHGATLIEDAAESLSATYEGKQTGTFGKYGIFSLHEDKFYTGHYEAKTA
jgi:dTDP-4-amino-4,6-dideoxygalactose transaminase